MLLKKFISFLLAAVVALSAFPLNASAAASSGDEEGKIYPLIPAAEKYYPDAADSIIGQLREFKTTIDVSQFKIHKDDMMEVFKSAVFSAPDIFYVNASEINYQFSPKTEAVATITPKYIFKKSKLSSYIKTFNKEADKLLDGIDSDWSAYKKALIIHDRLVVSCEYKKVNERSYTAYNAVVVKKANCEGYSRAYSYLLSKVGVDSKCINSTAAAHLWNYVKVGDSWYHVDVTSDDPVPDTDGLVSHQFFLLSDAKLKSYKSSIHSNYKNDISYSSKFKCSSKTYDDAFFRNVESQIVSRGDSFYYIKEFYKNGFSALMKRKDGKNKAIAVVGTRWYDVYGDVFFGNYSRICEYKNYLFFNSSRAIIRYNLNTKKLKKVFELPSFLNKDFYGIRMSGSYLRASYKKAITQSGSEFAVLKLNGSKVLRLPFLRYSSVTLKVNDKFDLKVYCGSGKTVYKSSAPKTVKINSKGRITALKKGKATITVLKNNRTMKCKVKVTK